MPRTKIVCTLGPASRSPEIIERLIAAGMDVARLNFSHGTRSEHSEVIAAVRSIASHLGRAIAIIQDLAGPKIRVGPIKDGPIFVQPGSSLTLTNRQVPGDEREISTTYPDLPKNVLPGDTLLLSDGALELEVLETTDTDIRCNVVIGGPLSSHKGIN
ncbi:MAG: pyruvate kinase, partial [Dehalococcoidia bacterium]